MTSRRTTHEQDGPPIRCSCCGRWWKHHQAYGCHLAWQRRAWQPMGDTLARLLERSEG